VNYVKPCIFDRAWKVIASQSAALSRHPLSSLRKTFCKLFIDGVSGSGKTRVGFELFKKLEQEKTTLSLESVCYAYIDAKTGLSDTSDIFKVLLRRFGGLRNFEVPDHLEEALAAHILGLSDEGRGVILLHIDEFTADPAAVNAVLNQLGEYQCNAPRRALILPVCTGLYAGDGVLEHLPLTDTKRILTMPYFRGYESTFALVRNAAQAWLQEPTRRSGAEQCILPAWLEKAGMRDHQANIAAKRGDEDIAAMLASYVVEDTAGWAMAAVQLGAHLAALSQDLDNRPPTRDNLGAVENKLRKQLAERYSLDVMKTQLGGVKDFGALKVAALALSPLAVCFLCDLFFYIPSKVDHILLLKLRQPFLSFFFCRYLCRSLSMEAPSGSLENMACFSCSRSTIQKTIQNTKSG
jgi:hypothetical protein